MRRGLRASSGLASGNDSDDDEDKEDDEDDEDEDDELDNCVLSWPSTVLSATILQGREAPDSLPSLTTSLTS